MNLTKNELQKYFDFDLNELSETKEDDLNFLEQNHFGDLLLEKYEEGNERFKLWRNLDCNGAAIEIEYCGHLNNYSWNTVFIEDIY